VTVQESGLTYLSYLLRLWQTRSQGEVAWRAALEDVQTGERRGFASLDDLVTYLRDVTAGTGKASIDEETM